MCHRQPGIERASLRLWAFYCHSESESGENALISYGILQTLFQRQRAVRCFFYCIYSVSTNFSPNSSMSVCKAGLRCIILSRIICGVSVINKKSAISSPFLRCSSVAHCSRLSLNTTLEHTEVSKGILVCQTSFAPKSGHSITDLPFKTLITSGLKHPCIPPVASHINSGI